MHEASNKSMRHIVAGTPALYACRLCAGCSIWYRVTCKIQCCKNVTTRFAPANFAPDVNATYCRRRIYSCARVGCAPLRGSGSWWHIRYSVAKMSRARWRGPGLGAARRLSSLRCIPCSTSTSVPAARASSFPRRCAARVARG